MSESLYRNFSTESLERELRDHADELLRGQRLDIEQELERRKADTATPAQRGSEEVTGE